MLVHLASAVVCFLGLLAIAPATSFLFLLTTPVHAYVPAMPANDTKDTKGFRPGGDADNSQLKVVWANQTFTSTVSLQVFGQNSRGLSQGPLLKFNESVQDLGNSTTPWIAFIACDFNATNADPDFDIFTIVRDKGAKAAVLYSVWSDSCVINPFYLDPVEFERIFDVFSMRATESNLIVNQYDSKIQDAYVYYNATLLNGTYDAVSNAINGNNSHIGYMMATLSAWNATDTPAGTNDSPSTGGAGPSQPSSGGGPNNGLAMIILYAITGCVSLLFCIVILSGAIRAIRNPERYGARPDDPHHGPGQSRAAGLGRAILDTFPIVKFGSGGNTAPPATAPHTRTKSVNDTDTDIEMASRRIPTGSNSKTDITSFAATTSVIAPDRDSEEPRASGSNSPLSDFARTGAAAATMKGAEAVGGESDPVDPNAIGHETCPICILDFEEGDDLRVLPCDARHRFHQACVDPWLLELSSSCPLCREDFTTLESMVQGADPDAETNSNGASSGQRGRSVIMEDESEPRRRTMSNPRFSKYLRFAQRRRNRESLRAEARPSGQA